MQGHRKEDIEDTVQEAFLRMYEKIHYLRDDTQNIRNWISTVTSNTTVNYHRKNKTETIEIIPKIHGSAVEAPYDCKEQLELTYRLMESISPKSKEAVLMAASGYDYKEIMDLLNVPMGTVKSRIHHGRNRLRELLESINHYVGHP
jgi:RNA polymerase sigma-70 factor (ECF subfamily)